MQGIEKKKFMDMQESPGYEPGLFALFLVKRKQMGEVNRQT